MMKMKTGDVQRFQVEGSQAERDPRVRREESGSRKRRADVAELAVIVRGVSLQQREFSAREIQEFRLMQS